MRCFEGFNKFFYCVIRYQFFVGIFGNYFFGFFMGVVENGDGIIMVFDVECEVVFYYCYIDDVDLLFGYYIFLLGVEVIYILLLCVINFIV